MARLVVGTSADSTTPALVAEKQPVISSLSVTPTTSAQTITAPAGTDGYSPVNVSAVTSSIDANITAGNIKKDVTILGVTGNYAGITPSGTLNISANGTYDVTNYASASVQVSGGSSTQHGVNIKGWCGDIGSNGYIRTDQAVGTLSMPGLTYATRAQFWFKFSGSHGLVGAVNLSGVRTVEEDAFFNAFASTNITSLDLSSIRDVYMSGFESVCDGCQYLTSVNLGSGVIDTIDSGAFNNAFAYTGLQSLTVPEANYIYGGAFATMCRGCPSLRNVYFPGLTVTIYENVSGEEGGLMQWLGDLFGSMVAETTNCVVHFRTDFGTDIVQWCADNEADPEFTTEQEVADWILNAVNANHAEEGTTVVFDIDPT